MQVVRQAPLHDAKAASAAVGSAGGLAAVPATSLWGTTVGHTYVTAPRSHNHVRGSLVLNIFSHNATCLHPFEAPCCVVQESRTRRALRQYAGNYKYNSLAGVESKVGTGAIYGTDEKATVCLFPRGSVNNWNVRAAPLISSLWRLPTTAHHAVRLVA